MAKYNIDFHQHGDHFHYQLKKTHQHIGHVHGANCSHDHDHDHHHEDEIITKNDEGCPCCAAGIDLDEVAAALNEISQSGDKSNSHNKTFEKVDFYSPSHWGIFLGISGPLALVGLTAAIRNVKGTLNNKSKLDAAIKGLEEDIEKYKIRQDEEKSAENKQNLTGVISRLEAFRETLKYSEFDTKFNLAVPGFINGAASSAVLSSAVVSTPFALPIIALYAGCQTLRNGYDLWRTWNEILPEEVRDDVELNMKVGIRKINQITDSKRKFYSANSLGFATFSAGAAITTLSALSVVGAPGVVVGLPLLAAGAVSTGITNNIWTNKFKPRNGDLGIERTELDLENIAEEIGERREVKKVLKNYRDKHLPSKPIKSFAAALLSSLPFGDKKGSEILHEVNQSRIIEAKSNDEDRLDLLQRMVMTKKILKEDSEENSEKILRKIVNLEEIKAEEIPEEAEFTLAKIKREKSTCHKIFKACEELEIDGLVLERFIKNSVIKSADEHDSSIKNKEDYLEKLTASKLFKINEDEIEFDLAALETSENYKKDFMNSLEECLLFDYVEKLKYEQYGLNDFFWALEKQNKQRITTNIKENIESEIENKKDKKTVFEINNQKNYIELNSCPEISYIDIDLKKKEKTISIEKDSICDSSIRKPSAKQLAPEEFKQH